MSIQLQGWLRKRPRFGGHWPLRYFVLDSTSTLSAYSTDKTNPNAIQPLLPTHVYRLNVPGIELRVTEPFPKLIRTAYNAPFKEKVFAIRVFHKEAIIFTIACSTIQEAEKWKLGIVHAIQSKLSSEETKGQVPEPEASTSLVLSTEGGVVGSSKNKVRPKSVLPDNWGEDAHFRVVEVTVGGVAIEGQTTLGEFPSLRAKGVVNGSPEAVFRVVMDDSRRTQWDEGISSCVVLKKVSDSCHIVHLETRAFWVGPVETDPRDLVLLRYWRKEEDSNSYVITWQSVEDPGLSAPKEGFVRGKIFSMSFAITPSRTNDKQCTVRVTCHADPGGSLSYMPASVQQHWLYPFVSRVIGLQKYLLTNNNGGGEGESGLTPDKIDDDAAVESERATTTTMTAGGGGGGESVKKPLPEDEKNTLHFGSFPPQQWTETSPEEPFRVRGKTYLTDGIKVLTGRNLFSIVAFDLNIVEKPMPLCAARSDSPLREIQRRWPPGPGGRQTFVLQFLMPGPPHYTLALYAVSKPGVLDPSTPFGKSWADFVEGTDEFRNSKFKIIPRATKGSYIVRKTVGETPAVWGKKIKINYYPGPGFLECDVDLNTSAVAASVLSVFKSYAAGLTADLMFTLEGHSEEELPEEILCSLRFLGPDIRLAKPLHPDPNPEETQKMRDMVMQGRNGEFKRKSVVT